MAFKRGHAKAHYRCTFYLNLQASWMDDGATVRHAEIVYYLELPGFCVQLDFDKTRGQRRAAREFDATKSIKRQSLMCFRFLSPEF